MATTSLHHTTHPPANKVIAGSSVGTVTNISCAGPATFQLYNGSPTGTLLISVSSPRAFSMPVSLAFTLGLYISHSTSSSLSLTYA